jgi:hypothetical protein
MPLLQSVSGVRMMSFYMLSICSLICLSQSGSTIIVACMPYFFWPQVVPLAIPNDPGAPENWSKFLGCPTLIPAKNAKKSALIVVAYVGREVFCNVPKFVMALWGEENTKNRHPHLITVVGSGTLSIRRWQLVRQNCFGRGKLVPITRH